MAQKNKSSGSGLMSSAGLMTYYDADKRAIHVQPRTVFIFGAICGIVILALSAGFGLWP